MDRFMPSEELARDRRFKRAKSGNTLLRSLPDDVNVIVKIFEQVAPKIRQRIEGTKLEEVFDDCFP